jgi:O-antigen/teichoic acid export membrane protein
MSEAPARPSNGAIPILVATAIGGGCGYVLMVFAGAQLGTDGYAPFAVFWSAIYLLISAISGVQQEVTRATVPETATHAGRRPVARNFAVCSALLVFLTIAATSPLWAPTVFGDSATGLMWPLGIGIAAYVVVAVVAGVFYGMQLWRFAALLVVLDGVIRLLLVGSALLLTDDMTVVAWAIALPFVLAPAIVWLFARRSLVGRYRLDVGYRDLTWNVSRTVVAAAATGVLISGFPLLLAATSGHDPVEDVAAIVFASNLTRAPLIVVVLALQSYLIVRFRSRGPHAGRDLGVVAIVIVFGAALLSLLAWLFGAWAFRTFFGQDFVLEPNTLATLVASASAVALLCATGPFVLARGRHTLYTAGWVAAALATTIPLALPFDLSTRALLALWVGPLVGLAIHLVGVGVTPSRSRGSED